MRLTHHSDLAFRALLYLAAAGEAGGTIPEIAQAYGVSEHHLRKVAMHLARHGLIVAARGRGGGLRLARAPEAISIGATLRQLEKDFALVECMGANPEGCVLNGCCGLQLVFQEALKAWFDVLDKRTLADALAPGPAMTRLLGLPAAAPDAP